VPVTLGTREDGLADGHQDRVGGQATDDRRQRRHGDASRQGLAVLGREVHMESRRDPIEHAVKTTG